MAVNIGILLVNVDENIMAFLCIEYLLCAFYSLYRKLIHHSWMPLCACDGGIREPLFWQEQPLTVWYWTKPSPYKRGFNLLFHAGQMSWYSLFFEIAFYFQSSCAVCTLIGCYDTHGMNGGGDERALIATCHYEIYFKISYLLWYERNFVILHINTSIQLLYYFNPSNAVRVLVNIW